MGRTRHTGRAARTCWSQGTLIYDRFMRHTSRKRSSHDPLAKVNAPTWLVVRDRVNAVLSSAELAPGTDLRAALMAAREARIDEGWAAEDIGPACGFFFASREATRVRVGVEHTLPRNPGLPESLSLA
jgi:hypothetical protein